MNPVAAHATGSLEPVRVGALAPAPISRPFACAVALRAALAGPVGVVIVRGDDGPPRRTPAPPPTLAAARIAAALRAGGHPAAASWRLVRCEVAEAEEAGSVIDAFAESGVPVAIGALSRRDPSIDQLLCSFELILAGAEDPIGIAAIRELASSPAASGGEAPLLTAVELAPSGAAVVLPLAGIGCPGAWMDPIDGALMDHAEATRLGGGSDTHR